MTSFIPQHITWHSAEEDDPYDRTGWYVLDAAGERLETNDDWPVCLEEGNAHPVAEVQAWAVSMIEKHTDFLVAGWRAPVDGEPMHRPLLNQLVYRVVLHTVGGVGHEYTCGRIEAQRVLSEVRVGGEGAVSYTVEGSVVLNIKTREVYVASRHIESVEQYREVKPYAPSQPPANRIPLEVVA